MAFSPASQGAAVAPARPAAAGPIAQRNAPERAADGTAAPAAPPRASGAGTRSDAIRTHASIAPGDALHSLREAEKRDRRVETSRAAGSLPEEEDRHGTLMLTRRKSLPYDPHPLRRPIIDIIA